MDMALIVHIVTSDRINITILLVVFFGEGGVEVGQQTRDEPTCGNQKGNRS